MQQCIVQAYLKAVKASFFFTENGYEMFWVLG